MKIITLMCSVCFALLPACQKDTAPDAPAAPAGGTATPPTAEQIHWDDPNKAGELDWPMSGADPTPTVAASAFGRSAAGGNHAAIWKRLSTYSGSFLKHWRSALEASDAPPPSDVVDAFNELALAVTGPAGFWRKTVPGRWLGCESMAESEPCKKVAGITKELEQWDQVQKQIDVLDPERAGQFLTRNEARILLYLDTYVPNEPSAEAMKLTAFYKKNLASVMDTWAGGSTNGTDL